MKKNLKIGFVVVLTVIISISFVAFGSSLLINDKEGETERDMLMSLEEYEKEYDKSDIIFEFSEGLTPENYFGDNKLIVRGKLNSIRGVAFTVGEAPCKVYELEVTDTIINNSRKEHKTINLAIPEMMISKVENKLQLDREMVFYLEYFDRTFPHLKEDYYGLISPTRGIVDCDGDEDSYKQLKENLLERKKDFDNQKDQ